MSEEKKLVSPSASAPGGDAAARGSDAGGGGFRAEAAGTKKHTPGPWEVRMPGGTRAARHGWREVWGPDRTLVIGASVVDVTAADGDAWSEGGVPMSGANARLIAAAPRLAGVAHRLCLALACAGVEANADSNDPMESLHAEALAAYREATGIDNPFAVAMAEVCATNRALAAPRGGGR